MKLSPGIQCDAPAFKSARYPQLCATTHHKIQKIKSTKKQSIILYQRLRSLIIKLVIETQIRIMGKKLFIA